MPVLYKSGPAGSGVIRRLADNTDIPIPRGGEPPSPDYAQFAALYGTDPSILAPADPPPTQRALLRQVSVEDFRTTNATQATLIAWALAQQTLYTARFTILATDVGNADCRAWHATATAKRVNNGAALVGTPTVVSSHADAGAAAWALAADASGNTFRIRVTGAAGRTISWSLLGEIVRARPDGLVD